MVREDFPSFLPPMMVKELRQGLRARFFVYTMILLPVILAIPYILHCLRYNDGEPFIGAEAVDAFFGVVVAIVLLLLPPTRAFSGISGEIISRASEFLVMTRLTSRKIVFQKWLSQMAQTGLLLIVIFPFLLLNYLLGRSELMTDIIRILMMYVVSGAMVAAGLWVSGMPLIIRVLAIMGIIGFGLNIFSIGSIFASMRYLSGVGTGPFYGMSLPATLGYVLFIVLVLVPVTYCILILACKSLAPPAENLASPLRRFLMWTISIVSLLCALSALIYPDAKEIVVILMGMVLMVYLGFFYVQSVLWERTLPVHAESAYEKKGIRGVWSRTASLFLMPGWESAGLFGLYGIIIGVGAGLLPSLSNFPEFKDVSLWQVLWLGLAVWASQMAIVMLLQEVLRKTGYYALLITGGVQFLICLFITFIFITGGDFFAGLLPYGNIVILIKNFIEPTSHVLAGIISVTAILLIFVVWNAYYWINFRTKMKKLAAEAPLKTRESFLQGDKEG